MPENDPLTDESTIKFQPQEGPQTVFLSTSADVAIYGGAAGGGKTFGLLMDPLRHIQNPQFGAIIFRRVGTLIRGEGALWDQSEKIYPYFGGRPKEQNMEWVFPSGSKIKFAHMQHEQDRLNYQGTEIPMIGFDEMTHFTKKQFMYMLSRNRSTCGVAPYIRGTCNPDSNSFVREMISWYIDEDTGLAIPERSGVVRYFVTVSDEFIWADTAEELQEKYPDLDPLSFTFIAATLYDNKILMETDPKYLAKLQAMPLVEREQLLGGNWNISENCGIIQKEWLRYYAILPEVKFWVWSLDTAVKEEEQNDPSAALLWAVCANGYYLENVWTERVPFPVLKDMVMTLYASQPSREVLIEDKSSGMQLIQEFKRNTPLPVIAMKPGKNMGLTKIERVNFVSTLFETGRVFIKQGQPWSKKYEEELTLFPFAPHDDMVDATSQFLSRRLILGDASSRNSVAGAYTTGGTIDSIARSSGIPAEYG
jgi:predicted phage terminase large subunit-like protein